MLNSVIKCHKFKGETMTASVDKLCKIHYGVAHVTQETLVGYTGFITTLNILYHDEQEITI